MIAQAVSAEDRTETVAAVHNDSFTDRHLVSIAGASRQHRRHPSTKASALPGVSSQSGMLGAFAG
jgi:hypothetical protein